MPPDDADRLDDMIADVIAFLLDDDAEQPQAEQSQHDERKNNER
jgi:hypothetical protein